MHAAGGSELTPCLQPSNLVVAISFVRNVQAVETGACESYALRLQRALPLLMIATMHRTQHESHSIAPMKAQSLL